MFLTSVMSMVGLRQLAKLMDMPTETQQYIKYRYNLCCFPSDERVLFILLTVLINFTQNQSRYRPGVVQRVPGS